MPVPLPPPQRGTFSIDHNTPGNTIQIADLPPLPDGWVWHIDYGNDWHSQHVEGWWTATPSPDPERLGMVVRMLIAAAAKG